MTKSWPLIYCNGDSYSDENYKFPLMIKKTFGHVIGDITNGFVISKSRSGSCNRRILRTSLHDLIEQRKSNPEQKIISLINLSFELRDEIWIDKKTDDYPPEESNFRTHQFSHDLFWRKKLLASQMPIDISSKIKLDNFGIKFLKKWSEGRAYFYSPYAERCNLLMDLVLFTNFLDSMSVNYLIFQGPREEHLESEHLIDFFKQQIPSDRVFDLETFGFCDWCDKQGFSTLDNEPRSIGHYGPDAHKSFAENILMLRLLETNQL
jgi:hypothetical protein